MSELEVDESELASSAEDECEEQDFYVPDDEPDYGPPDPRDEEPDYGPPDEDE